MVIVIGNAVGRARGRRDVVRLTRMGHAKVVRCEPICLCRMVNPRCVRVADQAIEAGVLHHDNEYMLEIFKV